MDALGRFLWVRFFFLGYFLVWEDGPVSLGPYIGDAAWEGLVLGAGIVGT